MIARGERGGGEHRQMEGHMGGEHRQLQGREGEHRGEEERRFGDEHRMGEENRWRGDARGFERGAEFGGSINVEGSGAEAPVYVVPDDDLNDDNMNDVNE